MMTICLTKDEVERLQFDGNIIVSIEVGLQYDAAGKEMPIEEECEVWYDDETGG